MISLQAFQCARLPGNHCRRSTEEKAHGLAHFDLILLRKACAVMRSLTLRVTV